MNQALSISQGVTMSSREVAQLTGHRHDQVLRTARSLASLGVTQSVETHYTHDQNGQQYPEHRLTKRDSLVLVARLSPEFTAHVVDRWQELEQKAAQPLSKAEMTLMVIGGLQEEVAQQAALIEQQKPAVDFAVRIASANKGVKLGIFAKAIGLGPNKIFEILRDLDVLMSGGDRHNMPYQKYINRGYFSVRQSPYEINDETRISHTALITGKGERWLNGRLIEAGVLKAVAMEASE